jgi:hypothetical protein
MVMLVGAVGTPITVFVSFDDLLAELPQEEVYNTRTLSPVVAARLLVNFTIMI